MMMSTHTTKKNTNGNKAAMKIRKERREGEKESHLPKTCGRSWPPAGTVAGPKKPAIRPMTTSSTRRRPCSATRQPVEEHEEKKIFSIEQNIQTKKH